MRRAWFAVILAGCTTGPLEPQAYFDALDEIDCQATFRCCDQPAQVSGQPTAAACGTAASTRNRSRWATVLADVQSGKLTYHADVAGACLNAQRGATSNCAARADDTNATLCSGVFAGSLPDGSDCPAGGGCASGSKCVEGKCAQPVAPLADGMACQRDAQCASGACAGTCMMQTVKQRYCG